MKVIGAGISRTGTMSLQAALEHLGYPCYHMQVVPREPGHLQAWRDMVSGKAAIDWPTFFKDYEAAVDAPVCFYFEELLQAFPEAKVILTVRDPKEWHKSLKGLIRVSNRMRPFGYVVPKLGRFLDLTFELLDKFMPGFETYDQDAFVQFFNEHNAAVKRIVPEDRLLVFQVKDGWEPLCTFLDCEVPQDIPFPRLNTGMLGPETKMRQVFNIK